MNRTQFLTNLKASKVKLVPLQVEGWDGLVYLRPQTVGEVRDMLLAPDEEKTPKEALTKDPLFLARSIAKIVRDEEGVLLFDPSNDDDMKLLMETLAEAGPSISRQINKAYNALNAPTKEEATPEGNSPGAKSS